MAISNYFISMCVCSFQGIELECNAKDSLVNELEAELETMGNDADTEARAQKKIRELRVYILELRGITVTHIERSVMRVDGKDRVSISLNTSFYAFPYFL